jgi:hypothetical protein
MRSDLLSNHLDVIGNLHHAFSVHWRFSTKLSSSICTGGSPPSYLLLSAYKGLFLVCLESGTLCKRKSDSTPRRSNLLVDLVLAILGSRVGAPQKSQRSWSTCRGGGGSRGKIYNFTSLIFGVAWASACHSLSRTEWTTWKK